MNKNKDKNKNKEKNKVFVEFFQLIKSYKKSIVFLFFLIVFLEALRLIGPYILKLIIDELLVFSVDKLNYFFLLILAFFVSLIIISIIDYFKDKKIFDVLLKAEYDLPIKCQKKLLELDLSYHQKEGTGDKITKIERGVFKFIDLLGTIFWELLPVAFQLISTSIILLFVDYRLFIPLLFFSVILTLLNIRVNKKVYPTRKQRYKNYEKASGKMVQSIINVGTVQSFCQQERELGEFSSLKKSILDDETKEWSYILKFANLREIIVGLGRITFLSLGIVLVAKNQISIGTLVFVITLSEKVFSSISRAYRLYDRFAEGAEGINRLSALLKTESTVENNGKIKLKNTKGEIKFKNVNFVYENGDKVLNNFNLHIPSGAMTALVGPSGGGKTTIIRLIFRHFDPISGQVLLDDHDLKDLELFGLRKFLSIVPQEVDVFNSTIAENISYAKRSATFKEIEAAAKIANAAEFIEKLPDKYNTVVGERGVRLSGGQRQRIGIARAVLADPKVLVFDEATSNLDAESEKLIQEAISKIAKDKTIIVIAHRLSTIKMADKIVVIEGGQVVEEGMHLQLVNKKDGLYRKLINLQSLGEISQD
ncbi:ABC transporter ATP-binding protein/permease [Patescibacteria group bacterium]|nr:ABC transporter ATP-binding protein/permease [Patescibacteria group bacterium]